MAVHIKLIKNNIKSSSGYGKYYAKAVSQGEISLNDIAEEACRNSGCSEGTVVMVVTELQDILKHRLSEGQTVVLPGIGRFSLRVESIGVDNPKDFTLDFERNNVRTSPCKPEFYGSGVCKYYCRK